MSVATDTARVGSWVGSPNIKRLVTGGILAAVMAAIVLAITTAGSPVTQPEPNQALMNRALGMAAYYEAQQAAAEQAREIDRLRAASERWAAGVAATAPALEQQANQVLSLDQFWRQLQAQDAASAHAAQVVRDWETRYGVGGAAGYSVFELLESVQHLLPKAEPASRPAYLDQIEDVQFGSRTPAITIPYSGVVGPN